ACGERRTPRRRLTKLEHFGLRDVPSWRRILTTLAGWEQAARLSGSLPEPRILPQGASSEVAVSCWRTNSHAACDRAPNAFERLPSAAMPALARPRWHSAC